MYLSKKFTNLTKRVSIFGIVSIFFVSDLIRVCWYAINWATRKNKILLFTFKATQKQLVQEKIHRQQKERELEANKDMVDRQGQEMDLLKALLAKLQKYERDLDQKHGPSHPKRKEVWQSIFRP